MVGRVDWSVRRERTAQRSRRAATSRTRDAAARDFANCRAVCGFVPRICATPSHELREHLRALGLHPAALVVGLHDLDDDARAKATSLWDTAAMLATYRALVDELLASKGKLERLPLDTAAAESMVLGRDVIRHINLDPVLPEELMPQRALSQSDSGDVGLRSDMRGRSGGDSCARTRRGNSADRQ